MSDTRASRSIALAALVLLASVIGSIALTGTVAAAEADGSSIDTDPADPNETVTHTVTVELTANEGGNALSNIYVNYSVDSEYNGSVANVTTKNVKRVGIDVDESGDIDKPAEDLKRVLHPHNGTLVFDFGGDTSTADNQSVIVVFNNTVNPTTGNYTVAVDVNTGSKFDPVNTTLTVGPNVTDYETETTEVTGYEPASDHDEIIDSAPPKPSHTATHHVAIATSSNEVGNSLSNIKVDYHADGSFDGSVQDVGQNDVKKVGFDIDGSGDIDVSTMDDLKGVSTSNSGETITFDFGGNYGLKDDYGVIIVYSDAVNPSSPGNYTVQADINTQSTRNPRTGSLVLGNFTFRNTTLRNITTTNARWNETTVLNSTWRNVTWTNTTAVNSWVNESTWRTVTWRNVTWTNVTAENVTWRNVTWTARRTNATNVTNVSAVTNVTNATWTNTTWRNVTVTNASVTDSTWANTTYVNVTVANATWQNTTLSNVTVVNATWTNVTWSNTTWQNVTWNATWTNATVNATNVSTVTNVTNATWSNTTWSNVTLTNATLTNSTWANATYENVTVANSTWNATTWENATVTNSTWNATTWENATLRNVTFSNTTLENVTFANVTLTNATIANVTWSNVTVTNATVSNATVLDATWENVTVDNTTVVETNLTDTHWTNASVSASFNNTTVENMVLRNATLDEDVAFNDTTVWDLNLTDTVWSNVTFDDSSIEHTRFLNVTEADVHHHEEVTLVDLYVDDVTMEGALLEHHKFKKENKYVKHIQND